MLSRIFAPLVLLSQAISAGPVLESAREQWLRGEIMESEEGFWNSLQEKNAPCTWAEVGESQRRVAMQKLTELNTEYAEQNWTTYTFQAALVDRIWPNLLRADSLAKAALARDPKCADAWLLRATLRNTQFLSHLPWKNSSDSMKIFLKQSLKVARPDNPQPWSTEIVAAIVDQDATRFGTAAKALKQTGFFHPKTLDFYREILRKAPAKALFLTHGDLDAYALWTLQQTEKMRPDIAVLNYPLLNLPTAVAFWKKSHRLSTLDLSPEAWKRQGKYYDDAFLNWADVQVIEWSHKALNGGRPVVYMNSIPSHLQEYIFAKPSVGFGTLIISANPQVVSDYQRQKWITSLMADYKEDTPSFGPKVTSPILVPSSSHSTLLAGECALQKWALKHRNKPIEWACAPFNQKDPAAGSDEVLEEQDSTEASDTADSTELVEEQDSDE